MAFRSALSNYSAYRAPKPPRVVSRARQPTTRPPARFAARPFQPSWANIKAPKPAKPPGAPPAPVAAVASTSALAPLTAALPVDPTYDATVASLARRRDDTLAGLTQQRTAGFQDYGYNPSLDAAGNVQSLSFDPAHPNSRAALMKKNYEQAKVGNTTNMAARGQLYSGALQTAQDTTDQGYGQNTDSLKKQLINFVARNMGQQTTARNAFEEGVSQAAADRVARAASSPLYDPEALAALQAQIEGLQAAQGAGKPAAATPAARKPAGRRPFAPSWGSPSSKPKPKPKSKRK